jgi:hypothetical protein
MKTAIGTLIAATRAIARAASKANVDQSIDCLPDWEQVGSVTLVSPSYRMTHDGDRRPNRRYTIGATPTAAKNVSSLFSRDAGDDD